MTYLTVGYSNKFSFKFKVSHQVSSVKKQIRSMRQYNIKGKGVYTDMAQTRQKKMEKSPLCSPKNKLVMGPMTAEIHLYKGTFVTHMQEYNSNFSRPVVNLHL